MILLVDAGNTRIKWAWLSNQDMTPVQAASNEPAESWKRALQNSHRHPQKILVANVRGAAFATAFSAFTQQAFGLTPHYVQSQAVQLGVTNGYQLPSSLGVDRWLALLAARRERTEPCLLVSSGTALTIDALDAHGQHLGGFIVPGLRMLTECGASDAGQALAALVLRSLSALQAKSIPRIARLVLAGGDASTLAPLLGRPSELRDDLVLHGLSYLTRSDN
jgi:type III pantothenate kinase